MKRYFLFNKFALILLNSFKIQKTKYIENDNWY